MIDSNDSNIENRNHQVEVDVFEVVIDVVIEVVIEVVWGHREGKVLP